MRSDVPTSRPRPTLRHLLTAVHVALSAGGGALQAQDARPDSSAVLLPGVRVEVLRSRILEAAPWSLTVREGDLLRADRGGAFLADALRGIPGLQVQSRHNLAVGDRIAIRGFGGRAQFGIRGLRIVVDGIPATLPDGQSSLDHLDPSTLERVEVLRGPGASFWGNAAGGVLAFETRLVDPRAGRRVRLRTGAGSDGLVEGTVSVGVPLANGAAEISTGRLQYDGFRTTDDGSYGAASRWTMSGRARFPVARGSLSVALSGLDLSADNPGSLPRAVIDEERSPAWGFNVARRTRKDVRQGQLGASWRRDDGGREVAVWGISRDVFNPIPTSVIDVERAVVGTRGGLRGRMGSLDWGLSVEAERQADARTNRENDGGDPGEVTLRQDETVTSLGAAAQIGLGVGAVRWTAALRYDRTSFDADDLFTAAGDPDDSGSRTMTALSPSVGLRWIVHDQVTLFSSVGSFFETPTTTELVNRPGGAGGFNPDLDPRRGWNGEFGLRTAITGGQVVFTGEVVGFAAWVTDELVPFEVAGAPGRTFFRNAGKSRSRGVEATADLRSYRGHGVRATWTRTDARFRESEGDDRGLAGNRIPGIAPNRFDVALEGGVRQLRFGLDVRTVGEIPVNDADTEAAPGSTTLDLRAGWSTRIGRTEVAPWITVRNLTDRYWISSVVVNAFGGRYFEPGPGRGFDAGVSITFGGGR